MFEALLVRALTPNEALLQELATLGVNPKSLETLYPTPTWVKVLDAVRRHHYGAVKNAEQAYRKMGKDFTAGYLDTLIGKVLLAAISFMNTKKLLERAPSYMRMGRKDMLVTFVPGGERDARLRFSDPFAVNEGFPTGIFDEIFGRMKTKVAISSECRAPGDFDLVFNW